MFPCKSKQFGRGLGKKAARGRGGGARNVLFQIKLGVYFMKNMHLSSVYDKIKAMAPYRPSAGLPRPETGEGGGVPRRTFLRPAQ